jgi:hypothetical protein
MSDLDAIMAKGAGVVGALISLGHVKGTAGEKFVMFVTGAASSYYASPIVADKLGLPEGACGFMVGLFGMSIVSKIYEYVQISNITDLLPFLKRKS